MTDKQSFAQHELNSSDHNRDGITDDQIESMAKHQMPRQLMFTSGEHILSNLAYPVFPNDFGRHSGYNTWEDIVLETYESLRGSEPAAKEVYFHGTAGESKLVSQAIDKINKENSLELCYHFVAADIETLMKLAQEKCDCQKSDHAHHTQAPPPGSDTDSAS